MHSSRQFSSNSSSQDRHQLERLWKGLPTQEQAPGPLTLWLKNVGHQLFQFLTGTQQLRIWTQETKAGKVWRVYDPITDKAYSCDSEQALRVWLEQRHL